MAAVPPLARVLLAALVLVAQGLTQATPGANPNQAPSEAGTGTISGIITDAASGQPVAGAVVHLGPVGHGPPETPTRQLTDARGRFVFSRLPAFNGYFLQVTAGGYFRGVYGRSSSGALGSRIAIADGQWFSDANVTLERPAAISGRIVDELGDPLVGVYVRALPRMSVAGKSQLVAGPTVTTDDRGAYRIGGLLAGNYIVHVPVVQGTVPESVFDPPPADDAVPPLRDALIDPSPAQVGRHRVVLGQYPTPLPPADGRQMAYPQTFFPSTPSPLDAAVLHLTTGEDRAGVDIQLRPVATHTLSGRLEGPPEALAGVLLRALPPGAEHLGFGAEVATTISERDGRFTFHYVPAGEYVVIAHNAVSQYEARFGVGRISPLPVPPSTRQYLYSDRRVTSGPRSLRLRERGPRGLIAWRGVASVRVDGTGTADVVIPMDDGASISGRFVWDDSAQTADRRYPRSIRLEPANGDSTLGSPQTSVREADRPTAERFQVYGLLAGRYLLTLSCPNCRIKSVIWNGEEYAHRPFDASSGADITDVLVTLTDARVGLNGTVRTAQGVPVEEAAVIVFPAEPEQWADFGVTPVRIQAVQTTSDATYVFQDLPAGRYLAVAVDADLIDAWQDPDFLRRAALVATGFELHWGETVRQDLRLVTVER